MAAGAILLLSVTCQAYGQSAPAEAATADPIPVAVDWRTGLAIYGIDPVAYFAEGKVVEGQAAWEFRYAGAPWRFSNEANRAAFAANPTVYMPAFGGNDPIALARGVTLGGNPHVWLLYDERLYLFHTPEARAAFSADPRGALSRAAVRIVHPATVTDP